MPQKETAQLLEALRAFVDAYRRDGRSRRLVALAEDLASELERERTDTGTVADSPGRRTADEVGREAARNRANRTLPPDENTDQSDEEEPPRNLDEARLRAIRRAREARR